MISTSSFSQFGNSATMQLQKLGIHVDSKSGHLIYAVNYEPCEINFDLVFIRHGETYGNCGQSTEDCQIEEDSVKHNVKDKNKRIFQGQVDTEINSLTHQGQLEALEVAKKLETFFKTTSDTWKWKPDLILVSPLSRAKDTAQPFIERNKLEPFVVYHPDIIEMSFGAWDNRRVCDLAADDIAHQFYQDQNALVKKHGFNGNNKYQVAENFVEVLLRAHKVIQELNNQYAGKKVMMFSHSMFGAALTILLGKGKFFENKNYLAFDGKDSKGTYYTIPHATPVIFESSKQKTLRSKL